jgi:hypothetical protein
MATETSVIVYPEGGIVNKTYTSKGRAQAVINKSPVHYSDCVAMTLSEFRDQDVEVEVTNLISGNPVMINKSQVGSCCDPSTERYHSM